MPSSLSPSSARVIIVGGGAAGFYAAISCAEAAAARAIAFGRRWDGLPENGIVILEQSQKLLHKVAISGGGRCNVTYGGRPAPGQVYPRGAALMEFLRSRHGPEDTMRWFQAHGVSLKQEEDGRMFPTSNKSASVVKCLKETAIQLGVEIHIDSKVKSVEKLELQTPRTGARFKLQVAGESAHVSEISCERLIFSCGSAQKQSVRRLFSDLDIPFRTTAPSLFSLLFKDPCSAGLQELAGISVPDVQVALMWKGEAESEGAGALLITHSGVSGPAILRLSAWGAFEFYRMKYRATLSINWIPFVGSLHAVAEAISAVPTGRRARDRKHLCSLPPTPARNSLAPRFGDAPRPPVRKKPVGDVSPWPGHLPARLWCRLIQQMERECSAENISKELWGRFKDPEKALELARRMWPYLTRYQVDVDGRRVNKEEFVTAGGVDWRAELEWERMESTSSPGVHFAGEVLDVDGITGGYNFQGCWSSGFVAGQAASDVFS